MNINDLNKTGDELIAAYRERMVLEQNQPIFSDAIKHRNGELVQLAHALICRQASLAPEIFPRLQVQYLIDLPDTERLIVVGAYIAAQIDVYNLMAHLDSQMKAAKHVQQNETEPDRSPLSN